MEKQISTYILIAVSVMTLYGFTAAWLVGDSRYANKMSPFVLNFLSVSWKICISLATIYYLLTVDFTPYGQTY